MSDNNFVEKNIHRTNLQRLIHTLCLVVPIGSAFGGYYTAPFLWGLLNKNEIPELFKFGISLLFFFIPAFIIFIATRKSDSIIKIRIFSDKKSN